MATHDLKPATHAGGSALIRLGWMMLGPLAIIVALTAVAWSFAQGVHL